MPVLFASTKNYSASEALFDESIYETAGDDGDVLFCSKIVVPVMIIGLGNIVFARQLKLNWQNQKLNIKKIFQAL